MPSFDVVSEIDLHEVQNALDQAERELAQRYDFRDTGAKIDRTKEGFQISANGEERVNAAYDVLVEKFLKRKLSLKFLEKKDAQAAGGQIWKMVVNLKKGIDKENAKIISQAIRDDKSLKVTPTIQGETLRVTGKKKDDLQAAMAILRSKSFAVDLSFNNFRE